MASPGPPRPRLLSELVARGAAHRPAALAVVDGDRHLTYAELDAAANQLAHLLAEVGVGRGERVGIYLDKSIEAVVAIHGVLKAGAAYVPLDPQAPPARLGLIAADCALACLVSSTAKAGAWEAMAAAGAAPRVLVTSDGPAGQAPQAPQGWQVVGPADLARQPDRAPAVATIDLDLAYVLYTSGSTGAPKGVMLTHLNAMAFVEWAVERFAIAGHDRLSSHAPLHFDLSILDLFAAAAAGAAVVLVPRKLSVFPAEIVRFVEDHGITVWYSVPSILTMLVMRGGLAPGRMASLRLVLFAGEVFPTRYLAELMALVPGAGFHNLYGPTETNVCTHYEVSRRPTDATEPVPIGSAVTGVEVFAVTDAGERAGVGETGELYVRGTTVMAGYWADPDRTAEVLAPHPSTGLPDRAYRTGDLVRLGPDGNYRFLGRRDTQVKSRGYRIELGDVEAALYSHPQVAECAVVAVPDEVVTNRLRAYVVLRDGAGGEVSAVDLARSCRRLVPSYMVPEEIELRESLPKTSTGKIDRRSLAD